MPQLPLLPTVDDVESYEKLWASDEPWRAFVDAIREARSIAAEPVRFWSGSAVVYRLGEFVLKLYPPIAAGDADVETHLLSLLASVPEVPSPRPVKCGHQGDWSYLLMTHSQGAAIDGVWGQRSQAERIDLARQAGEIVRVLHQQNADNVPRVDASFDDFRRFCRERAPSHHLSQGFSAARGDELQAFLRDLDREPELDDPHVLLHTELGPNHLLVEGQRITGLLDFAEARAGLCEYDFAAVGLFVTRGNRAAFTAFLDAYGVPASRRGRPMVRRLMRHALLHQYGHLTLYLNLSPVPHPEDLASAAEHWFGHD